MRRLFRFLPASARLYLRVWQRCCADFVSGQYRQLVVLGVARTDMPIAINLQQAIMGGDAAAYKVKNLQLAINCLQGIVVEPGQLFSFWHCVGRPASKKGYQKSRSIVQGKVVDETGGGLCQLSGLIYLLALKAGLTISERHAHSLDIYREGERFTPLGSDATVSFGYKDLRFVNNLPHPIGLQLNIAPTMLSGSITSAVPIAEKEIRFNYTWQYSTVSVVTLSNDIAISNNIYTRLYPNAG